MVKTLVPVRGPKKIKLWSAVGQRMGFEKCGCEIPRTFTVSFTCVCVLQAVKVIGNCTC